MKLDFLKQGTLVRRIECFLFKSLLFSKGLLPFLFVFALVKNCFHFYFVCWIVATIPRIRLKLLLISNCFTLCLLLFFIRNTLCSSRFLLIFALNRSVFVDMHQRPQILFLFRMCCLYEILKIKDFLLCVPNLDQLTEIFWLSCAFLIFLLTTFNVLIWVVFQIEVIR